MDITMFSIIMDPFSRTHLHVIDSQFGYWLWNQVTEWASSPFVFFSHAPWARDVWDLCGPTITHCVEIFGFNENSNSQSLKKPSGSMTLNIKRGKTESTHLVVLWENEPLLISPKLITTSSHYDYEYICMWACSTQFFSSYCDTLCVSFCHKSVSQGTCNTCEGNPSQGDVLCREQSLQVDKLADTLPAASGAPQEKNKTDKADNMANWCLRN